MRPSRRFSAPLLLLLTALAAPLVPGPADAASRYQIELLVFLNKSGNTTGGEFWPADPGAPSSEGAVMLQAGDPRYPLAASSDRRLNPHRYTLDKSGRYEALLHLAWRQTVTSARNAEKLYLEVPGLSGTIRISRGRYLHADLDLLYRTRVYPQQAPDSVPGAAVSAPHYQDYRLRQSRRMRSDELHYLDHPVIGALLIAHRLKPVNKTPEAPAESVPSGGESAEDAKALPPN